MTTPADELTAAELERLSSVVTERSGMAFDEGRWPFLRTRVREVMARAGFTNGRDWVDEIEASASAGGGLYEDLEQALHVHETRFFRYDYHHRVLAGTVLPEIMAATDLVKPLRVLSIGCSTGEEPYSLAMTLSDALGFAQPATRHGLTMDEIEVLGIDVSREALAHAMAAEYGAAALGDVPERYVGRYVMPAAHGLTVARDIRALVRFFHHDIRRDAYLGKFDIVVCCNVLLYFTAAARSRVIARIAAALRRGGFLFLGHAEGLVPPAELFRCRYLSAGIVHQRL